MPGGCELREQRLDETEVGQGTAVTFVNASLDPQEVEDSPPDTLARQLGLPDKAVGRLEWNVFEAVMTPGQLILMLVLGRPARTGGDERAGRFQ